MEENKPNIKDFEINIPLIANTSSNVSLDFVDTTDENDTQIAIQPTEADKSERNPNAVHVRKYRIYLR